MKCIIIPADPKLMVDLDNTRLIDAYRSNIIPGSNKADIQLPGTSAVVNMYICRHLLETLTVLCVMIILINMVRIC